MPKFLAREEIYRILQRELPEDVYSDGAPSAFFTTSDMDSVAKVIETQYTNLSRIYANYFPQTADEYILKWELKVFGKLLPAGLTLQERIDSILTRMRSKTSMSTPSMKAIVLSVIGSDKDVEIVSLQGKTYGWILDVSQLDINTYLNAWSGLEATGPTLCKDSPSKYGLTQAQWDDMRYYAYNYQVRIYSYTLSADERAQINEQLNIYEPARSLHIILDGLDPSLHIYGRT